MHRLSAVALKVHKTIFVYFETVTEGKKNTASFFSIEHWLYLRWDPSREKDEKRTQCRINSSKGLMIVVFFSCACLIKSNERHCKQPEERFNKDSSQKILNKVIKRCYCVLVFTMCTNTQRINEEKFKQTIKRRKKSDNKLVKWDIARTTYFSRVDFKIAS